MGRSSQIWDKKCVEKAVGYILISSFFLIGGTIRKLKSLYLEEVWNITMTELLCDVQYSVYITFLKVFQYDSYYG